jgi:pilus assembly protein Flp/PilA
MEVTERESSVGELQNILHSMLADKTGASAIEYALIAALISVAILGAVITLGVGTANMWSNIGAVL